MTQKCLSFDGIDDYVNCGSDSSIDNIWDGGGTFAAWINFASDGQGNSGRVIDKDKWRLYIRWEQGGMCQLALFVTFDTTSGMWRSTTRDVAINQWHFVVITYNADSADNDPIIYVDGDVEAVTEDSTPEGTRTSDAGESLYLGNISSGIRTFDGLIDEARISNKIRTATEISDIWNNGNGVQFEVDANTAALWHMNEGEGSTIYDETDNDNDGSITGASWADGYDFLTSHPTSSDAGSGLDASTLSEVFFSADSGVGLGALAALLAVINTSEVSAGSDRLRAKIESATTGGDMKLPPDGRASFPSRKVGI